MAPNTVRISISRRYGGDPDARNLFGPVLDQLIGRRDLGGFTNWDV